MNNKKMSWFAILMLGVLLSACGQQDSTDTSAPAPVVVETEVVEPEVEKILADTVFINGKVLTVDENFSVAQAIAIKDGKILAVGSNDSVSQYSGDVIDLEGKTVIPGLIDNHMHFIRAGQRWDLQARIDGVNKRQEALDIIAAKAATMEPGEWFMVQGGWDETQFADGEGGFTVEELDAASPNNPMFLQAIYLRVYANSLALQAVGVDPAEGSFHTGPVLISPQPPYGKLNEQMPKASRDQIKENVREVIAQMNRAGLTSVYDVGRPPEGDISLLNEMSENGPLNMRVWHTLKYEAYNSEDLDKAIELIQSTEPNQTDDYLGMLGLGEHIYLPFFDRPGTEDAYSNEIMADFGRVSRAAAEKGFKINEHTMMDVTINSALDQWAQIDKEFPLAPLRWSIEHVMSMSDETIKRAADMGLTAAVHSVAMNLPAPLQPPMRRMQDAGLVWGLGSDSTIVAAYQPFISLGWAITGKSISGKQLNEETVTREEALVAHTRSNAYLLFKEDIIGSLEVGKYADLVVLNKDYMTVPEDEIFYIEADLTMVEGRVVYDRAAE